MKYIFKVGYFFLNKYKNFLTRLKSQGLAFSASLTCTMGRRLITKGLTDPRSNELNVRLMKSKVSKTVNFEHQSKKKDINVENAAFKRDC